MVARLSVKPASKVVSSSGLNRWAKLVMIGRYGVAQGLRVGAMMRLIG